MSIDPSILFLWNLLTVAYETLGAANARLEFQEASFKNKFKNKPFVVMAPF
jgi:hypothetical protein